PEKEPPLNEPPLKELPLKELPWPEALPERIWVWAQAEAGHIKSANPINPIFSLHPSNRFDFNCTAVTSSF
ncbi:MAG TPA: hypothetical protein VGY77_04225, partial [Gemmataceae bacterium]|nr:hypothetical protein [Gemmataceae bacterium]